MQSADLLSQCLAFRVNHVSELYKGERKSGISRRLLRAFLCRARIGLFRNRIRIIDSREFGNGKLQFTQFLKRRSRITSFKTSDSKAQEGPQNQVFMYDRHFCNPNICIIRMSRPVDPVTRSQTGNFDQVPGAWCDGSRLGQKAINPVGQRWPAVPANVHSSKSKNRLS